MSYRLHDKFSFFELQRHVRTPPHLLSLQVSAHLEAKLAERINRARKLTSLIKFEDKLADMLRGMSVPAQEK